MAKWPFLLAIHVVWVAALVLTLGHGPWLALGVVSVAVFAWIIARDPTWRAPFHGRARDVVIGAAAGVGFAVATHVVMRPLLGEVPFLVDEVRALYARMNEEPGPVRGFALLVVIVAAEEIVWREGLARACARAFGDVDDGRTVGFRASVVAALVYGLVQIAQGSLVLVVAATALGLVLGVLRARTGNLVAPLVAHLVWDALVFVLWPLPGVTS